MAATCNGPKKAKRSKAENEALGSWRAALDKREAPAIDGQPIPLSVVSGEVQAVYDRWVDWLTKQGVMSQNYGEAVSLYALNMSDLISCRQRIVKLRETLDELRQTKRDCLKEILKFPIQQGKKVPEALKLLREQFQMLESDIDDANRELKQINIQYRECETVCMRLGPEFGWSPLTRRRVPLPMGAKAGEGSGALSKFKRPMREAGQAPTVPFPQKK